jgi:hypothetical protein
MKIAIVVGLLLCAIQASAGTKNYPTRFQVLFAVRSPGDFGRIGACSMRLRSESRIYDVAVNDTFHPCVIFAPGTVLRGSNEGAIRDSMELVEETGGKPKIHKYWVRDVELAGQ